ncbi:MAG: PAS domain-containing sensor histidine kinase [Anaerolineae bacterium]
MQLNQKLEEYTAGLELRVRERTSQLEQSKERLEAILNNSVDAILLIERDFTIRQTNHTFQHMFACAEADYLRRPMNDLLHESTPLPDVETLRLHEAGCPPFRLEARAVRLDRTEFDAELILTAIQEDGFVGSIRDVTDRKRAENALKQALAQERELGELKTRFVSMASHEFRTPLAGILASSETLLYYRAKMQEADVERRLQNIQRQVKHMTAIMEDVLQLGRMQSGQIEFQPADTDLNALCHEVIADWNRQPEYSDRIRYRGPGTPLIIPVDATLIRQSIDNLISNALKYSSPEKPVMVTLRDELDCVTFQVRDEGIGIPEADIPKLFEPFHRASNASSVSGTGLGLSITKQAIEQHSGKILVESVVNEGTTFTIRLPIKGGDDSTIHMRPR